jgi:hypothetical protein
MRNAVLEQIIPEYTTGEIEKIIRIMTTYKKDLGEKASTSVNYKDKMRKESYDSYYPITVNKLKIILDKRREIN